MRYKNFLTHIVIDYKIKFIATILIAFLLITCGHPEEEFNAVELKITDADYQAYTRIEKYWAKEIQKWSQKFNISDEYLKALTILECSGKKEVKPRFEKEIYKKLKLLKAGKLKKFENISYKQIKKVSDKQLKKMASSWGPVQIMGYKCFWLGISIDELIGDKVLFYSVKWIDETYGNYVRTGRYKDAFHIHNAGKLYPKNGKPQTHDPDYVKNGLKHLRYYLTVKDKKIGYKKKKVDIEFTDFWKSK